MLGPHFWITFFVIRLHNALKQRYSYVSFLFSILTQLLGHNYVTYLFDVVTIFDNVIIKLYFDAFELRIEKSLQLRFVFARHCDVFYYVTITLFICSI